jgi:hypothetical protein
MPRPDSMRVRAQLELEVGEDPDRWVLAVSERGGKERGARGLAGPGEGQAAGLVRPGATGLRTSRSPYWARG